MSVTDINDYSDLLRSQTSRSSTEKGNGMSEESEPDCLVESELSWNVSVESNARVCSLSPVAMDELT